MSLPLTLDRLLPLPGPLWGLAPQRPADGAAATWRWPRWRGAAAQAQEVATAADRVARKLRAAAFGASGGASPHAADQGKREVSLLAQAVQAAFGGVPAPASDSAAPTTAGPGALDTEHPAHRRALVRLRHALRRHGLTPTLQAKALGFVAAQAGVVLGTPPYRSQLFAAAALLDDQLVEMATGEGKTLATALAAAVAGLAGLPVHVVTANDYLAGRDAATLAPLYRALGLSVGHLDPALDRDARRAVYAQDVVYATARELAFDQLRDQLAGGPLAEPNAALAAQLAGTAVTAPMQRGLCMALLDEADSILLDEAEMPLVLSQPVAQPAQRALWFQALALVRQLTVDSHCSLHPEDRRARLTDAGRDRLSQLAEGLDGPWQRPAWREEIAETALAGLHLLQRDRHYLVRDGAIALLDEVTGRAAPGRVWSRGLQTVVALKEGLKPDPGTETIARTTYPRFFKRYWRLAGLSGTLTEARAEFAAVYGLTVLRVPLHRPSQRAVWPTRQFPSAEARWAAVVARCAALQAAGRPVLVGTDSVAESQALAACLAAAGLAHRVLNALHDADEAATVAAAGQAGAITVATRMAGRGTDITLDAEARAAGGLHVINCQRNPSARLDRQLAGRAARHGDPGSTEALLGPCLSGDPGLTPPPTLAAWTHGQDCLQRAPAWLAALQHGWWQWQQERQGRARRLALAAHDRDWTRRLSFTGPAAG